MNKGCTVLKQHIQIKVQVKHRESGEYAVINDIIQFSH